MVDGGNKFHHSIWSNTYKWEKDFEFDYGGLHPNILYEVGIEMSEATVVYSHKVSNSC